ncbi:MAG: signal peptide peptidase SppA [Hyphomicrobiales bacterium]|jgi:protease-4
MSMDSMNAQSLVERRKLRRSRSLWRVLAVLLFVGLVVGILAQTTGLADRLVGRGEHVARVELDGFIDFDDPFIALLEDLEEDDDVKAVILEVNSPGGVAVAGEVIYTQLRALAETKPLVAVIEGIGTSAAYLAASASEHIIARNGSIVGSIGVVAQFPDVSELLDTVGIDMYEVRSGELKAQPSIFSPPSEEAIAELERLIASNYDWFVDQIEERRGLDGAVIRGFEGTVFTGARGVEMGLVDAIGGEDAAMTYLAETHSMDAEIDVLNRRPERPMSLAGPTAIARLALGQGGQVTLDAEGLREALRDAMLLDGILSLWHGR